MEWTQAKSSRKRKPSSQPNTPTKGSAKKSVFVCTDNVQHLNSAKNLSANFTVLQSKDVQEPPALTPPPIFITQITNPSTFKLEVIDKVIKNSKLKIVNRSQFKVVVESIKDYHDLTKLLKSKKINFFTHQVKEDKAFRVVCQGIPVDFPNAEETVRNALE